MTYGSELFMRDDPQLLSKRLAAFVREIPAKQLAAIIGGSERTAENIRRGHWPIARHWLALVRTFGRDLTDCVFHPDAAAARLQEEVAELEAKLAERRAALRVAEEADRASARPARAVAADEARAVSARH